MLDEQTHSLRRHGTRGLVAREREQKKERVELRRRETLPVDLTVKQDRREIVHRALAPFLGEPLGVEIHLRRGIRSLGAIVREVRVIEADQLVAEVVDAAPV